MKATFSKEAEKALDFAVEEAARCGSMEVLPGHLFLALIRSNDACVSAALRGCRIDPEEMKEAFDKALMRESPVEFALARDIAFSGRTEIALALASQKALAANLRQTGPLELLIGLLRCEDPVCADVCSARGLREERVLCVAEQTKSREALLQEAILKELRQRQDQGRPQAGQESEENSQKRPLS